MKIKTPRQVEKYIKREFCVDIPVSIQNHFWGGFWGFYLDGRILLSKRLFEKQEWLVTMIWHEVGHHFTVIPKRGNGVNIKNEVNAQIWAIRRAKEKGYLRIRQWLQDDVINSVGWKWIRYRRARKLILNKITNCNYSLMR